MAKRRRHRRHRRRYHPHPQRTPTGQDAPRNNTMSTPLIRTTPSVLTPIQNVNTPLLRKRLNSEAAEVQFATPKNRNVCPERLSCTNLNRLFEERLRGKEGSMSCYLEEKLRGASLLRSISSAGGRNRSASEGNANGWRSRLAGLNSSAMVDVATQTVDGCSEAGGASEDYDVPTFAHIFQTPANYTTFMQQQHAGSTPLNEDQEDALLVTKNFMQKKNVLGTIIDCAQYSKLSTRRLLDSPFYRDRVFSVNRQRFFKSLSPKVNRSACLRLFDSRRGDILPPRAASKGLSPMKLCPLGKPGGSLSAGRGSLRSRIVARMRSFHQRYTSRWTERLAELCEWLGVTIKMGLSAIYNPKTLIAATPLESPATIDVKMKELEAKIEEQGANLEALREEQGANLEALREEQGANLEALREEQGANLEALREEQGANLEALREEVRQLQCQLAEKLAPKMACTVSSVAPPPPPPPLPPPMPVTTTPVNRTRITRSSRDSKKDSEDSRPAISLDDILKVKLRKPGDRAQQQPSTKVQRRGTAHVSMDMLRQVKLRPASRQQTPSFADISSPSTSPVSSLARLLAKDQNENGRVPT